jgi:hypothetical protein
MTHAAAFRVSRPWQRRISAVMAAVLCLVRLERELLAQGHLADPAEIPSNARRRLSLGNFNENPRGHRQPHHQGADPVLIRCRGRNRGETQQRSIMLHR